MGRERGFSLIELMVVVVIIAILAAVVVPSFLRESKKVKGNSEVTSMFGEIASKEELYKTENGTYASLAACNPAALSSQPQDMTACTTKADWLALHLQAPETKMRCSYVVTAGPAGNVTPAPSFGNTPATSASGWYYVVATCNLDDLAAKNSMYLQSSLDAKIQVQNEGH